MAGPNIQYFTPDVSVGTSAGPTSAAQALPNSADALLYIVNMGPTHIFFKLGTTNAVTVTSATGQAVLAGQSLIVGAQGMSWIALCNSGGINGSFAVVNLTSGN